MDFLVFLKSHINNSLLLKKIINHFFQKSKTVVLENGPEFCFALYLKHTCERSQQMKFVVWIQISHGRELNFCLNGWNGIILVFFDQFKFHLNLASKIALRLIVSWLWIYQNLFGLNNFLALLQHIFNFRHFLKKCKKGKKKKKTGNIFFKFLHQLLLCCFFAIYFYT